MNILLHPGFVYWDGLKYTTTKGTNSNAVGPASGDLSGAYPNPTVIGINGYPISGPAPISGQVLGYNSGNLIWTSLTVGATGPAGPTGAIGVTGAIGHIGPTGVIGPTGAQGVTGAQGIQGVTGAMGPTGVQGIQGVTGAIGPAGSGASVWQQPGGIGTVIKPIDSTGSLQAVGGVAAGTNDVAIGPCTTSGVGNTYKFGQDGYGLLSINNDGYGTVEIDCGANGFLAIGSTGGVGNGSIVTVSASVLSGLEGLAQGGIGVVINGATYYIPYWKHSG